MTNATLLENTSPNSAAASAISPLPCAPPALRKLSVSNCAHPALLLRGLLLGLLRFGFDLGQPLGQGQQIGHRQIAALLQFQQARMLFLQSRLRQAGVGDLLRQIFGPGATRGDIAMLAGQLHHGFDPVRCQPYADAPTGIAPAFLLDRQQGAIAELRALAGSAYRGDALADLVCRQLDAHIVLVGQGIALRGGRCRRRSAAVGRHLCAMLCTPAQRPSQQHGRGIPLHGAAHRLAPSTACTCSPARSRAGRQRTLTATPIAPALGLRPSLKGAIPHCGRSW